MNMSLPKRIKILVFKPLDDGSGTFTTTLSPVVTTTIQPPPHATGKRRAASRLQR